MKRNSPFMYTVQSVPTLSGYRWQLTLWVTPRTFFVSYSTYASQRAAETVARKLGLQKRPDGWPEDVPLYDLPLNVQGPTLSRSSATRAVKVKPPRAAHSNRKAAASAVENRLLP